MTWEPRPTPVVTGDTAKYWAAAADGKLLVNECGDCGLVYHYPRPLCPDCFSDDVEWVETAGTGEIYTYSVVTNPDIIPDFPEDSFPHILAFVELDEGPRVLTNIVNTPPDAVEIGGRVEVQFEDTEGDDVGIPVFELAD